MELIPGIATIIIALIVMFRLMHYAHFYAPSYFFWIGIIISIIGVVSILQPLSFLFIRGGEEARCVAMGGFIICLASILWPAAVRKSPTSNQYIDKFLPDYAFNEVHTVRIKGTPDEIKSVLHVMGVKDIPIVHLLMKIRGIADEDVDMSDRASKSNSASDTFSTPDFNFFVLSDEEFITFMILKSSILIKSKVAAPPEVNSPEEFLEFSKPRYVKVAMNFRFDAVGNGETVLSTETRIHGTGHSDAQRFARYWRVVYPGSAIIRRVWLDAIRKRVEKVK